MKYNGNIFFLRIVLILFFLLPLSLHGKNIQVSSIKEFNLAQNRLVPDDTISWKSGYYKDISLLIYGKGLTVMSESPGKVVFSGNSHVDIAGDSISFSGFQFLDGACAKDVITISGDYNLVTQVNISNYTSNYYLNIKVGSQYNTVSYSNFENKPQAKAGEEGTSVVQIQASPSRIGYHKVSYCSFKNHYAPSGAGGDYGMEALRIGYSYECQNISRTIIEYCYFYKCNGDGEIISNKAKENIFRYNNFNENGESHLTLRHGDDAYVYGNFFLNGQGVRIKEGQHYAVFNNYFQTGKFPSIQLQNHKADPLDSITIAYNTFVDCGPILLGGTGDYKPEHVVIANNIFKSGSLDIFKDPSGTETWIGNIASSNSGTDLHKGIQVCELQLELNTSGYYVPLNTSPAINKAVIFDSGIYDIYELDDDWKMNMDLMQGNRPDDISQRDVGCTELPSKMVQPFVNANNTGPNYLNTKF